MSMRPPSTQPTQVELRILKVLWDLGPATVRQVHEALEEERDLQYTTALKMLLTMHAKGLVARDESSRSHVYRCVKDKATTQKGLLRDLMDRAFGGSAQELAMMLLREESLAPEEKTEIKGLLEKARSRKKS
jgi:BlaI family transcriptional regulator, penicillinase repressor